MNLMKNQISERDKKKHTDDSSNDIENDVDKFSYIKSEDSLEYEDMEK